jgi:hypothetical protein
MLSGPCEQELRKTGFENLFVDDKMKNTQGEEVKLAKLPKQVLAKEPDATSVKVIQELKDITTRLGSEVRVSTASSPTCTFETTFPCHRDIFLSVMPSGQLDDMHKVADKACRQLSNPAST